MNDSWHSYPSIFALGHRALAELFLDTVIAQEKVDGSQFSFGRFGETGPGWVAGEPIIKARSKGADLNIFAPDKMFAKAVETVLALEPMLRDGWTYRGEYLLKPKHNALAYDRVPKQNIILFDINVGYEDYLPYDGVCEEAVRLGLEVVPRLFEGAVKGHDAAPFVRDMLGTISCLGGQPIEGVVIKNYRRFGLDKKVLMGKFVSEKFKEVHGAEWKKENPAPSDIIDSLIARYRTPARWEKAVQHLREAGKLEDAPRDIGLLFKEVPEDIEKECADEIKELLYAWAWPKVRRGTSAGLAEWYKEKLLEQQLVAPE